MFQDHLVLYFNNLHNSPSITKATSIISNNDNKNKEMIFSHTYRHFVLAASHMSWTCPTNLCTRSPGSLWCILLAPEHHPTSSWSVVPRKSGRPRPSWRRRRTGSRFRRSCTCQCHGGTSSCRRTACRPHSRASTGEYGRLKPERGAGRWRQQQHADKMKRWVTFWYLWLSGLTFKSNCDWKSL